MDRTVKTSITASYRVVDGWHVFVSDELPGLYVASPDLAKAYDDVAKSIELLISLDRGITCCVTPEVPFDEFVAAVKGYSPDEDSLVPSVRRFAVLGACA